MFMSSSEGQIKNIINAELTKKTMRWVFVFGFIFRYTYIEKSLKGFEIKISKIKFCNNREYTVVHMTYASPTRIIDPTGIYYL